MAYKLYQFLCCEYTTCCQCHKVSDVYRVGSTMLFCLGEGQLLLDGDELFHADINDHSSWPSRPPLRFFKTK